MRLQLKPRKAFTLVELLVVIAIIGTLVGLLLPAVQQAREAGRRASCENNLKQIGLSVHNYSDSFGYLPSSIRPTVSTATTTRVSTLTELLPFLEQNNLYEQYNQAYNWYEPTGLGGNPNAPITATYIPVFVCPSTQLPTRLDGDPDAATWTGVVAITDYGATIGVDPLLTSGGTSALVSSAGTASGVLYRSGNPRFADVSDGLSNTILYAESAGRPYVYQKGKLLSTDVANNHVNGGGWARPASELLIRGSDFTGTIPDGQYAVNFTNGYPSQYGVGGATTDPTFGQLPSGEVYAFHPAGANIGLADGSVRFLSDKTTITVLAALVTRNGGETLTNAVYLP